jgi:hypothetical protein
MSIWDDKDIASTGDYVKFEAVGDGVEGTITNLERHTFTDDETGEKRVTPKLTIACTDGTEKILTAGQVRLRLKLVELRPEVGDYLKVTMTELQKIGKKTLKHFDVVHKQGDDTTPATTATKASTAGSDKPPF